MEMKRRCPGCARHADLSCGRARHAAIYPKKLCMALARGIRTQLELDGNGLMMVNVEGELSADEVVELNETRAQEDKSQWRYWDDVSGKELDSKMVEEARREEIEVVRKMGVWTKVPRAQCLAETGRPPVGTRWVDTNKGDDVNPKIRSRIVAQELKRTNEFELFAATPPIDYIKFLLARAASEQQRPEPSCIMIVGVKKAYFYAPSTRRVYINIPKEDQEEGDEDRCGILLKSLDGTRDAALNWSVAYGKVLQQLGFAKGASSPCTFWHCKRNIKMTVHGDDVITEGSEAELRWLPGELPKHFEIKFDILGAAKHLAKAATVLNRIVEWRDDGISWEPDPRQGEFIVQDLGLKDARPMVTPGVRDHSRRRGKAVDDGEGAWVKAADKVTNALVKVGDSVVVRGHGPGVVASIVKEEMNELVEVNYVDGTKYVCQKSQIELEHVRYRCRECMMIHEYGKAPVEDGRAGGPRVHGGGSRADVWQARFH